MRITVIGAGAIGAAIVSELLTRDEVSQVQVCDRRARALQALHERVDNPALRSFQVDARDVSVLHSILRGSQCVISCVTPNTNIAISQACLKLGIHYCDLGGNEKLVEQHLELDREARSKATWIVPNCGLAPGLVNILSVHGIQQFDEPYAAHLRVGDVPLNPEPPYNFRISWSADKVIDDYTNPVYCIRDGEITESEPLKDTEDIQFPPPFHTMEAFSTQGGLSTLTHKLEGQLNTLDHKTIRWPGHASQMQFVMGLGFGESRKIDVRTHLTYRDVLARQLKKKLGGRHADAVLLRVVVQGEKEGQEKTLVYQMIKYADEVRHETAVERCTSLPVVTIAMLLGLGEISGGGASPPEHILDNQNFLQKLVDRGLPIETTWIDGIVQLETIPSTQPA